MRFIPNTSENKKEMMKKIGIKSIDQLFESIPAEYLLNESPGIGEAMSEQDVMQYLNELSKQNLTFDEASCFIGEIAWYHYVPSIVRAVTAYPSFYTAYTPYQPELSQGTLQAIYEFQSYMANITGMEASNASLYDGATAAAEAILLATSTKRKKHVLISSLLHPYVKKVLYTYAEPKGIKIDEVPYDDGSTQEEKLLELITDQTACILIQTPNAFGVFENLGRIQEIATEKKIASIALILESMSLGVIKPPGSYGFDIVCGEAQSFGMYPQFGGPGLGYICVSKKYIRKIPGRIVGKTEDIDGNPCFVMTLRAREQDIRRDKATSNICTNNALCALQATVYLSTLGRKGFIGLAKQNYNIAHYAMNELNDVEGLKIPFKKPFFNEFLVEFNKPLDEIREALLHKNILVSKNDMSDFYPELKNAAVLCFTEMVSKEEILELKKELTEVLK